MIRGIISICIVFLCFACNSDDNALPLGKGLTLKMGVEGSGTFEENIHSLSIYAFRKSAENEYFYYRTLIELNKEEIQQLEEGSSGKLLTVTLLEGSYKLFFVANAVGNYKGELQPFVTKPSDVVLTLPETGVDSIYFLGNSLVKVNTEKMTQPVSVILKRAISKLGVILYGIPESIDSVRFDLQNITTKIAIDGSVSPDNTTLSGSSVLNNTDLYKKDTVNFEMLTFPTGVGKSDLKATFVAKSGEERSKVISSVVLQSDQYVVVTGDIDDQMGAFLSFNIQIYYFIFDNSKDFTLPDFVLTPNK